MNDAKQDSETFTSHSKLSATVPAFVPREAYTGPTFPNNLVINSNLSPLVPEFKPSVSVTSYALPYKPGHHFQYPYHQSYIKQGKFNIKLQQNVPFQAYQTSLLPSRESTAKAGKTVAAKKIESNREGENTAENNGGENLNDTDSTVSTKKKRRRRKKKGLNDSTLPQDQEELNSKDLTEAQKESTVVPVKVDFSGTNHKSTSAEENKLCSSGEQNSTTLNSSLDSSSANTGVNKTNVDVTAFESVSNTAEQSHKKQHTAPNFTVSYSDKVKSLASKNSSIASSNLSIEKSWTKDFSPESSGLKNERHSQNSEFQAGKSTLTNNVIHGNTKEIPGGRRIGEERGYNKLKNDNASKSCTKNVEQCGREVKQMRRNNSLIKKMTCDNDDNWRLKRGDAKNEDPTALSGMEKSLNSNVRNVNTESVKKWTYQGEEDAESKKFDKSAMRDKSSSHIAVNEEVKYSDKHQNLCELSSASPVNEAHTTVSSANISDDLQNGTQKTSDSTNININKSVVSSNEKALEGEFPDLHDSVKIKRSSALDKRTTDHKEATSPQKPSAPMSYSAVLRSTPQPKSVTVSPAWESEHPTKQGGLLKVPPQATADGAENEAEADENKQKKKKKKKKKKPKEAGDKAQESSSSKRTEKPIQFDLGVMLQSISTSSAGKKQSNKRHVLASGVLPNQLSSTSTSEVKPNVRKLQLLKKDGKVPHNVLDSTAPVIKRGKERETPAKKKPSALKKIILKEREEKKKAREGETVETDKDDEISQDEENRTCEPGEGNIEHQEVQSTSEDDMAYSEPSSPTDQEIAAEMHSRKFREYCFQVPDKEVDTVATELLRELVRFQDRQFHKDPVKAKAKRRFVLGLREVSKHLKLRKLKCVIISSNVERIKSAGGLDDALDSIITSCQENQIPVVFALKRQLLGKVLLKKVPVSIVGIFNYDGAQEHFKTLIELTQKTRQAYTEKWKKIREKLELQQKENKEIGSTTDTDKELSAGGDEVGNLLQTITEEDAVTENHLAETTESSDNDDEDDHDDIKDDKEDSDDRHNETDAVIIENDLKIHEL